MGNPLLKVNTITSGQLYNFTFLISSKQMYVDNNNLSRNPMVLISEEVTAVT